MSDRCTVKQKPEHISDHFQDYVIVRHVSARPDATPTPFVSTIGPVCYRTMYEDRWRQPDWCPAPLFEAEARRSNALSFGLALELLQIGIYRQITRSNWAGERLEYHDTAVFMRAGDNRVTPWVPTEEDLVASDWTGS